MMYFVKCKEVTVKESIRFPQTSYRAASVLLAFILATFCSALLSFSQTGTTHALLIGIDEYEAQEIPDLAGCANDVELMRRILIGKFDVAPANITVLKNEQATRRGIIDAGYSPGLEQLFSTYL